MSDALKFNGVYLRSSGPIKPFYYVHNEDIFEEQGLKKVGAISQKDIGSTGKVDIFQKI